MNPRILLPALLFASLFQSQAADLTLEQIESIKKQAEAIKENLDTHLSTRNSSAGERFAAASTDPRAAVALYLDCHKLVNFDREGRPESDFRAWKDGQEDRLKQPENVESLQMQLRYLALSCKAAGAEKIEEVFTPLLSYVDSLSRLEELPTGDLTSSVAGSIFARAFYLDRQLGSNQGWEPVPFNIGGMYEKTIFPYLRAENPGALMGAWDKRIEQQTRIAQMINHHKEEALRGLDRDEQRRARANQDRQGGIMKDLDMDDFTARTLPKLKWAKLKDMFHFVSEVDAVQAMLPFLKEHLTHELGEDFFAEFYKMIEEAEMGTDRLPGSASE
ncbi:hypothetical protein N9I65_00520 [bacterium]|nr:hypothetical protein [bacterium]